MSAQVIFLEKDGTLVEDMPYSVNISDIRFVRGAIRALKRLAKLGFSFIIVTNQSGIAQGLFEEEDVKRVQGHIEQVFKEEGLFLLDFYYCPHHPKGHVQGYTQECSCRKPYPGLLERAHDEHNIDFAQSWMIGDILDDIECGRRVGCHTVLINNGHETQWKFTSLRQPDAIVTNFKQAVDLILLNYPQTYE